MRLVSSVRSDAELGRAQSAATKAELPFKVLDEHVETVSGKASISTMHLAKGLEFRAVVVMACDDEVIPLQSRIEAVSDDADLEEVYNTERHLLYVACTRARDYLLVTSTDPASEFWKTLCVNQQIRRLFYVTHNHLKSWLRFQQMPDLAIVKLEIEQHDLPQSCLRPTATIIEVQCSFPLLSKKHRTRYEHHPLRYFYEIQGVG